MREAEKARSPAQRWGRGIALALGLSLILLIVYEIVIGTPRNLYHRYTSPPLPDGTCYTFLYPTYLKAVRPGWLNGSPGMMSSVRIDSGRETVTLWDRLRARVGLLYVPQRGSLTVVVGRKRRDLPPGRREFKTVNSEEKSHDVVLLDGRSQMRLWLSFRVESHHPELFARDNEVVAQSFRVLPPGAPPPSP